MEVGCTNHSYLKLNHQILLSHLRCVCRDGGSKFSRLHRVAGEGEARPGRRRRRRRRWRSWAAESLAEQTTWVLRPSSLPRASQRGRRSRGEQLFLREPEGRRRSASGAGAAASPCCIASIFGRRESLVNPMCTFYKFLMFTYFYIL